MNLQAASAKLQLPTMAWWRRRNGECWHRRDNLARGRREFCLSGHRSTQAGAMLSGLADHGILPLGVYLNGVRGWVAHTAFNAGKLTQRRSGPAGGATRTGVPPARGINTKALEAMKQRRRGDRLIPGSRTLATD